MTTTNITVSAIVTVMPLIIGLLNIRLYIVSSELVGVGLGLSVNYRPIALHMVAAKPKGGFFISEL